MQTTVSSQVIQTVKCTSAVILNINTLTAVQSVLLPETNHSFTCVILHVISITHGFITGKSFMCIAESVFMFMGINNLIKAVNYLINQSFIHFQITLIKHFYQTEPFFKETFQSKFVVM